MIVEQVFFLGNIEGQPDCLISNEKLAIKFARYITKSWPSKNLKNTLKFIFIKYFIIYKRTYRDNKETLRDTGFKLKIIYLY